MISFSLHIHWDFLILFICNYTVVITVKLRSLRPSRNANLTLTFSILENAFTVGRSVGWVVRLSVMSNSRSHKISPQKTGSV